MVESNSMQGPLAFRRAGLAVAIAAASLVSGAARAAEDADMEAAAQSAGVIEEVVVTGRLYDLTSQLVDERLADEAVTNLLSSDTISRIGDADVAAALQRVSGLNLVNGEFIYVRGLGERYSSTLLNGARVPSVDLSRSVIPLDLFPTFVVESLRVQKSYSPDVPAAFGGGQIEIRTRGLPDGLTAGVQIGSGFNSVSTGDTLTSVGGSDDALGRDDGTRELAGPLRDALTRFQGDISVQNIRSSLQARGQPDFDTRDAQELNRSFATLLERDLTVREQEADPDGDIRGYLGNSMFVGDDLELGFLVSGGYSSDWRNRERLNRSVNFPEERTDERIETTHSVDITLNGNFGARLGNDHELLFVSTFIRNTDDEVSERTFFNENRQRSSGLGFKNTLLRYEEREVQIDQLRGSHRIGSTTRALLEEYATFTDWDWLEIVPEEAEFSWFFSDSEATTSIPNEVSITQQGSSDENFQIPNPQVVFSSEAADYRFTDLDDEVQHHGWELSVPFFMGDNFVELSGGFAHIRQARDYRQIQFALGPLSVDETETLSRPLGEVFSDEVITNPANNFVLNRTGTNSESYVAATMTDAWFGNLDWTWADTIRIAAGARWEQYRQVALDLDPFSFSVVTPPITTDTDELIQASFSEHDLYPALSVTYMDDWLAETFQLRFGYSTTVTRPDLREITDASYIDPLTDELVFGNPGVTPAEIDNWDARAEWFFSNGDNFTVSLFYKDIADPIEFFEAPASDTQIAREIINADSAEVYGVEIEWLKEFSFARDWIGDWADGLFLQGNVTIQDSELVAGPNANSPTSPERELVNASPWIVNLIAGYDSMDGQHSATVSYNTFDERLFVAGRLGAPDGFEQTRHSLNATYQWFPTDTLIVRVAARNLLDEEVIIERGGVETFREEIGLTYSLSLQWNY